MSRFCPPVMEVCTVCVLWVSIPISGFFADFLSVVHHNATVQSAIAWCVDPVNSPDIVNHDIVDMPLSDVEMFVHLSQVRSGLRRHSGNPVVRMKEE